MKEKRDLVADTWWW